MHDYPDYTELMQVIGSDIMMPIDVQAAYVMMPVDIQAQYVTLDIDIVAQTVGNITIDIAAQSVGNIDINIANSDITVDVDITAQTIGNLTINISAQSIGVYLQPDWQTKEGNAKTFYGWSGSLGFGQGSTVLYNVPSGKTLYICGMSFRIGADAQANADLNQIGTVHLTDNTITAIYCLAGGNGGTNVNFSQPAKFPGGHQMELGWACNANHNCAMSATTWGYEV